MNQLAFSSKQQPQDERALRVSSNNSSPHASPTHRRTNSSGGDGNRQTKQQPQRHLHVQFAVQNVPPSPLMYQQHQRSNESSSYGRSEDAENDRRGSNTNVQQQQQQRYVVSPRDLGSQQVSRPTNVSAKASAVRKASTAQGTQLTRTLERKVVQVKPKKKAIVNRKPAWDADVQRTALFFDNSIKRSTLFQPKPGDRRKETEKESLQMQDRPQKAVTQRPSSSSTSVQRRAPPSKRPNSLRNVKSTISNISTLQLPPRPAKDFVRLNFERITGRPYDQNRQQQHRVAPAPSRQNVFERLSKPLTIPKSLLRSVHFSELPSPRRASTHGFPVAADSSTKDVALSPISPRSPPRANLSPRLSIRVDSPVPNTSPNQEQSPRSSVYSSSSPRASQKSSRSRSPRFTRAPGSHSVIHQQQSYGASVFAVLDCQQRGRIGVHQILEGLRLLGLPATHNQISDYVYLIHEGDCSTINLEEWEILVGTLDAASQPPSASSPVPPQHSIHCDPLASAASLASLTGRDRVSVRGSHVSGSPRSLGRSNRSSPVERNKMPEREYVNRAEPQHQEHERDYYIDEIQRRVDEMLQRAEDTAHMRWRHERMHSNEQEGRGVEKSDQILRQAASVVYSLKASLFPLIDQAEALLRGIHKRQGAKLSLLLPQEGLDTIAKYSDDLASAILDDILLDTAQMLSDEEKQSTQHQMELHQVDQLDAILQQIKQIEDHEDNLIQQGLVLGYSTPKQVNFLHLGQATHRDGLQFETGLNAEHPTGRQVQSVAGPLVLPLGVVMNVDIPEHSKQNWSTSPTSSDFGSGNDESRSLPTKTANPKVSVSILSGQRYLLIEKRRQQFQRHRRLVESSLAGTGTDQCAVIEILEEMLLDDLLVDTTNELDTSVTSLADTLVTTLI